MKREFLFLILALLCASGQCFSQYGTDGRSIIDNLYLSPGHLPINDLVAEVEVYTPLEKETGTSTLRLAPKDKIVFKRPNKLKIDSILSDPGGALDGKQIVIIRDGSQSWMYVPAGQYPVKTAPDDPSPTLTLPPNIQTYPQEANNTFTIVGVETIGKIPATIVKIDDKDRGEVTTIWVDKVRWVPLKLKKEMPNPKGLTEPKIVKTCTYGDFKRLKDGRWFPFSIQVSIGGITNRVIVIKALSINVGVEDHLFQPMDKIIR